MSQTPIADYALLSDCHSAALVSRAGSVDWMCLPRFDSPAIFARLLDEQGGHWSIRPVAPADVRRQYAEGTLILETRFATDRGEAVLSDGLAVGVNERGHDLGAESPHALLRRLTCVRGEVELEMSYAPRPEYGLVHPLLTSDGGGLLARGGPVMLRLSSPVETRVDGSTGRARFTLREGESRCFALQYCASWSSPPDSWSQEEIERRLENTLQAWRSWSKIHQRYEGPWRELVLHSGRVLQGLTYHPTGAIVAAPTTSLPEIVGGGRNWDYRFTWVRDASFTLEALWVAACPDEAHRFFDFLTYAALTQIRRGRHLQIMFGIGGEHDLTERELSHLSGWRHSRPVRVGNGAWNQEQLDVYGELLSAVHRLKGELDDLAGVTRQFLAELADTAAARWGEKDHGIWEIRGEPRHYLYSKLMCWLALDRAIELAGVLGAEDRVPAWRRVREEIRSAIEQRGWSEAAGAFTQSFGSDALDASNLVIPIVGFLPVHDARVRATIEATAEQLSDGRGLVYRYRSADGLAGEEGSFLLCTFWLAQALALTGDVGRAKAIFSTAAGFANDVGLLSEEVDPQSGELLGNFPQAFSHIGLVNAAWAIAQAEQLRGSDDLPGRGRNRGGAILHE